MNNKIQKKCGGYEYTSENGDWSVTTDYIHGKIYIGAPADDEDLQAIKRFGVAIGKAVADMRKDAK